MTQIETPKEVEVVQQEIKAYVDRLPITVTSDVEMKVAINELTKSRKEMKDKTKWFDETFIAKPKVAFDAAKTALDHFKKLKELVFQPFKQWEQQTDQNVADWRRKEAIRIQQAQSKENAKYEQARVKAEEKGKDPDAVKPPKLYQEPPKTIKTEFGSYTSRVDKELVIFNEALLPDQYLIKTPNKKLIEQTLRAGQDVPGARLEEKIGSAMRV